MLTIILSSSKVLRFSNGKITGGSLTGKISRMNVVISKNSLSLTETSINNSPL